MAAAKRLTSPFGLPVAFAAALFGCDEPESDPADAGVPVFADEWASTYVELRGCRLSIEHELEHIRVLADPATAAQFGACLDAEPGPDCDQPFSEGAVLLKAQYRDDDCTDLLGFTAVRRQADAPAAGGGWRWQAVEPDGAVTLDGAPPSCVGCHQTCEGPGNLLCAMDP